MTSEGTNKNIYKFTPKKQPFRPWWQDKIQYQYAIVWIAILCSFIIILMGFYYGHKWLKRQD